MNIKYCFIGLIVFLGACNDYRSKYEGQYNLVHNLLIAFSNNDSVKVKRMLGVRLNSLNSDDHMLNFEVNKAYELIKLFGIPGENKYLVKEYDPKDPKLADITIPIFKGKSGSLREATIDVFFVKYLPKNKIMYFKVNTDYEPGFIQAPDSIEKRK
jgi:hypothetical protein